MYGKIFGQMYEGTLASRGPWEALVTFQQLIVLANRHGEVDMTPEVISRRTTIPLEIIQKGLAVLAQPDPDSRTPDEDGRRIVLLDPHRSWGWRLVNYLKYCKIRSEEDRREYQKDWAAKRRQPKPKSTVQNIDTRRQPSTMSTHVDVDVLKPMCNGVAQDGCIPLREAPGFEDRFWVIYPRKRNKARARRAWHSKVKPEEVDAIIARVQLNLCGEWKDKDVQYIPHPATWLNDRRWEDEIEQPRQAAPDAEELQRKRKEITPAGKAILEKAGYLE